MCARCGYFIMFATFALAFSSPTLAQFETRGTSPVLTEPYSIAIGDFNHDGKLDMAVASVYNGITQVSVLLGNGDGSFKPATYYSAGSSPDSIVAADFNKDGNLDLAVGDSVGSSNIAILLGNGDGTFQAPKFFSVPYAPTYVAVGDFNNDHKLDLVVTDKQYVSVLLGNGDGTFQAAINTKPSYDPLALGVGNFNSDGNLDVVVGQVSLGVTQVQVLLGNGDGTFGLGQAFPVGDGPSSIAVGDFRRIGRQDLAVACSSATGVDVLLGNGDGTFKPAVTYPDPSAFWVVISDLNGDGKLDLAVANFNLTQHYPSAAVSTLLGNGDGTFQPAILYPAGKIDTFVGVGDFNSDEKNDLAVVDEYSNDVVVLLNTGVVTFSPTTPLNFKKVTVGTTSPPQTVTLTNTGKSALAISAMKAAGQFGMTSTCGTSVAPGANCAINVTFSPQTKGPKSGTVTIRDSASSKPQVIELSGTGT